jgi:glycosyltransferase involved in cell wall biosynthesis
VKLAVIGPVYPYRGGIAHYTTMLYRALRNHRHQVLLVSFKRQYPRWLFPGESDRDPSQKPLRVENTQYWIDSLNPITWLVAFWRIYKYRPSVIVLQWWTTFWAPVWWVLGGLNRIFLRRPLVIICHNVLPHEARWWDSLLARAVFQWGTRFIVQSAEEERRLLSLRLGAQVAIAPHPVYSMFANDRVPKEQARRQLQLPLGVPVLLFFGIVREYKGLQDVLVALPEIRAQLGRVILLIAGEFWGDKRPYLGLIEQLRIGDSVIIEDKYIPNEDVAVYFSAADVLVAPYRRATGSGVVQMARGFGTPVITTNVSGGVIKGETDGQTNFAIPPMAPQSLANAILCFFQANRPVGADESAPCCNEQFSWDDMVDLIAVMDKR